MCVAPTANTPECTSDAQCASRTDGKTTCDVENEVCVAPTANTPECGNGVVEAGESCDKNDLNGKQCDQYPDYIGGTLACNAACEFDKSGCFECTETDTTLCASSEICSNGHCVPQGHQITCGDNMAEGSEACDGTDLKGKSCADFDGFHDGTLKCNQCKFDTSSCVECSLDTHCADRTDGKTKCSANVCTKDGTSAEAFCGNNSAEAGEDCDGSDLRGKSCTDFAGFSGGTLKCTSCTFDKSACKKPAECGNGILETGEDCDGSLFLENQKTCASWNTNYSTGNVSCKDCKIDYSECGTCGNGKLDNDEDCDGTLFKNGKKLCIDWDKSQYNVGNVSCKACQIDYGACSYHECENDEAICSVKDFALKKCVNNKWTLEKCPVEKPYCQLGAEGCSMPQEGAECNPTSFVPFTSNGYLYYCGGTIDSYVYGGQTHYVFVYNIKVEKCSDNSSGDCMTAKSGYGAFNAGASQCSKKGGVTDIHMGDGVYACAMCKPNQDGALYYLLVPAKIDNQDHKDPSWFLCKNAVSE